jgi:hydroxypyruvate isomerase
MYASPCIEWLFADQHPDFCDRIRAAKDAGFQFVEFHLWRDKPLDAVRRTLDETGMKLSSMVVEPRRSLVDPAQHDEFIAAVKDSLQAAKRVGAPALVVASGFTRAEVSRQEQHDAAVSALRQAAALAEAADILLLLEPLNTRVEHPGMYLESTSEGLDIVEEVASPNLKLLYDKYHSSVMDEASEAVLKDRFDLVGHVQVADMPGRHEPGSGVIDWPDFMATLKRLGYAGPIGLEYKPSGPTPDTLARAHAALGV